MGREGQIWLQDGRLDCYVCELDVCRGQWQKHRATYRFIYHEIQDLFIPGISALSEFGRVLFFDPYPLSIGLAIRVLKLVRPVDLLRPYIARLVLDLLLPVARRRVYGSIRSNQVRRLFLLLR